MKAVRAATPLQPHSGGLHQVARTLPEETPVAMVYNGSTQAVMMATPSDLEDFAVGFSLTEGIVNEPSQISDLEIVEHENGIECRMWLSDDREDALKARRRFMAGPVGCGLCGIDSLDQATRKLPQVAGSLRLSGKDISAAAAALRAAQPLHDETRAMHAAGVWHPERGLIAVREDVGRHNALDKLIGGLARAGEQTTACAVVLTSRVSVEMVQKTAIAGAPILIAVSSPTAHAVRLAEDANITLAARVRGEDYEIYTHAERITGVPDHVA